MTLEPLTDLCEHFERVDIPNEVHDPLDGHDSGLLLDISSFQGFLSGKV